MEINRFRKGGRLGDRTLGFARSCRFKHVPMGMMAGVGMTITCRLGRMFGDGFRVFAKQVESN